MMSQNQKRILYLLTEEFKTVQQIASIENKSHQAVYKTMKILKAKGLLKEGYIPRGGLQHQKGCTVDRKIRLHNIQISIKILEKSKFYINQINQKNKFKIGGATIVCYKNSIDVYTEEGLSFYGNNSNKCYAEAINFFNNLYIKIENRLKISIQKDQYLNKKWVRQHIAETNNELAATANAERARIAFKGEDNKEWLITDRSFNGDELEFIHAQRAKQDFDTVMPYMNDFRNNQPLTNSQLTSRLCDMLDVIEKLIKAKL